MKGAIQYEGFAQACLSHGMLEGISIDPICSYHCDLPGMWTRNELAISPPKNCYSMRDIKADNEKIAGSQNLLVQVTLVVVKLFGVTDDNVWLDEAEHFWNGCISSIITDTNYGMILLILTLPSLWFTVRAISIYNCVFQFFSHFKGGSNVASVWKGFNWIQTF